MILSRLFSPFFLAGLLLSTSSAWAQEQAIIPFSSGPVSLPIRDFQTTTSSLEVSNLPSSLSSSLSSNTLIRVKASIDHTSVEDLVLTIFSPSGTPITLASRLMGDCDFLYQNITFDFLAPIPVPSATCPQPNTPVSYQPMVSLQSLISEDLNGNWTFQVRDVASADIGIINSWSIEFEEVNDVDECALGTHNCSQNAICTNLLGSFNCTCMPGLEGDGVTCVDLLDAGDKAILDEFYDSISFPGKEDLQRPLHWCGSTFGRVACENHRVSSIHFGNSQIAGTIPSSFGDLRGLTYLNLDNNMFAGTIPTELGNLSDLWALVLSSNQLSGPIPTELGNLPNVYGFDFSDNQLSGTIPTELGNAPSLSVIFLQDNQLTGSVPSELRNLPNLNALVLAGNPFCPTVDYSWAPNNDFQGPHPSCITPVVCGAETHYDFDLIEGEIGSSQTVPSKHVEGTYTFECTQEGEWAEVSNTLEAACPAGETKLGFFDMTGHGKFATRGCPLDAPGYVIRYCSQAGVWEAAITSCPI